MEIRKVSDSVSIYSDGKRLQVIHNLGDEFILDIDVKFERVWDIDKQAIKPFASIEPVFKICGFCSKAGEDMHRLRWAILQFEEFERYIKTNQEDLMVWWNNPGRENNE